MNMFNKNLDYWEIISNNNTLCLENSSTNTLRSGHAESFIFILNRLRNLRNIGRGHSQVPDAMWICEFKKKNMWKENVS